MRCPPRSAPSQAPPAVQAALNQLIKLHFPKTNGSPVCVIRPQWEYNLKYVPLTLQLRNLISPAVLDPDMELSVTGPADLADALWTWRKNRLRAEGQQNLPAESPRHLAVLSFAGLDTHDCLLYPLLAHELGHLVDYSFHPPLSLKGDITQRAHVTFSAVSDVLTSKAPELLLQATLLWSEVVTRVTVCVRELLADLLALRMMGFGFFAAQSEFLKTIAAWPEVLVTPSGYPGTKFRLWSILRHLLREDFPGNIRRFLTDNTPLPSLGLQVVTDYVSEWESRVKYGRDLDSRPPPPDPTAAADVKQALDALAQKAVLETLESIVEVAKATIPDDKCASLSSSFFDRVARLERDLPPTPQQENPRCFAEIMTAGWAYQLCFGEEREAQKPTFKDQAEEHEKTCRLLLKSIELMPAADSVVEEPAPTDGSELGGVVSGGHIARRVRLPVSDQSHLGVVPLNPSAIQAASLDVHLGNWFVAMRRTRLRSVPLGEPAAEWLLETTGSEEIFIPHDKTFLIHPGDLVLGSTLEFVSLPGDLTAFVEGKSGMGRMGLIIATASQVAPGFHGVVVLELANAGTVPLELKPGMPVAQLVFQTMSESLSGTQLYRGRFYCQIKP